jgi:hypothetical protein
MYNLEVFKCINEWNINGNVMLMFIYLEAYIKLFI